MSDTSATDNTSATGNAQESGGPAAQKDSHGTSRKLTGAELRRARELRELTERLEGQGYVAENLTVSLLTANVLGVLVALVPAVLLMAAFFIVNPNGGFSFSLGDQSSSMLGAFLGLIALFAGFFALIVVHELIHGLFFGLFAPSHRKAIEFGFVLSALTPYCTCKEPLTRGQYLVGALAPCFFLGVVPGVIAILTGHLTLLAVAVIMVIAAGGDLLIALKLIRHRVDGREVLYVDHPYECGLIAFVR